LRSAASSSRTEEEATAEEAVAEAAKEEVGFDFARRALMSAGTDAGAAAPQARSISQFLLALALPLRFAQQVTETCGLVFSSCAYISLQPGPIKKLVLLLPYRFILGKYTLQEKFNH
jgi:ADP-ribose pyrophosphatase YjhB (NUDIX family)